MTPSSRQEIGLGMVSGLFSRALGVRVKGGLEDSNPKLFGSKHDWGTPPLQ